MGGNISSNRHNIYCNNLSSSHHFSFPVLTTREIKLRPRVSSISALRRKLIRRKRKGKYADHSKILREFVANWSSRDLLELLDEYEALAALKDLTRQAELARPPAATYKQHLSALYDFKYCTDIDLIYHGACYPAHRAIVATRCAYFREILAKYPVCETQINVDHIPGLDTALFSLFLRYLYSQSIGKPSNELDASVIKKLGDELGVHNQLEQDLRHLLESGEYSDTILVFNAAGPVLKAPPQQEVRRQSANSEFGFMPKLELRCHRSILSSRSPYFRNLIRKYAKCSDDICECSLHTRITLDETVIPKKYAKVLLHAIYLDTVDLSLIYRNPNCGTAESSSLNQVQALTNTGHIKPTPIDQILELYHIGRFLELDIVTQGCEDLICEYLTIKYLPQVLSWGSQQHGSAWVYRQAKYFFCEEFSLVSMCNSVLSNLKKEILVDCLSSDFIQASELEILQTVLKWAELEIYTNSGRVMLPVSPKDYRIRSNTPEYDEIFRKELQDVMPLVRSDHVIPTTGNELLEDAVNRNLMESPPSHCNGEMKCAWLRSCEGLFVRPRLFMPFYEEIKAILEERQAKGSDLTKVKKMPDVTMSKPTNRCCCRHNDLQENSTAEREYSALVPDAATMKAMLRREQKLTQAPSCQRALMLPHSSHLEIMKQIRLRVVREFNLPDLVADILQNVSSISRCSCSKSADTLSKVEEGQQSFISLSSDAIAENRESFAPSSLSFSSQIQCTMTFPRNVSLLKRSQKPVAINRRYATHHGARHRNAPALSDTMPDVAMPSTSAMANLSLSTPLSEISAPFCANLSIPSCRSIGVGTRRTELELDLGDGKGDDERFKVTTPTMSPMDSPSSPISPPPPFM